VLKIKTILSIGHRLGLGLVACLSLVACNGNNSSEGVTDPANYEYKGASDPLVATPGADRADELAARFALIQGRQ